MVSSKQINSFVSNKKNDSRRQGFCQENSDGKGRKRPGGDEGENLPQRDGKVYRRAGESNR